MRKKAALETPSIQSLGRGLSILEAVAESPEPVPLKQLTDLLGIDRSSVFRLANTLRQRRFLANPEGSNDYILGPSAWRLSRRFGRSALITFCQEHLQALTDEHRRDVARRGARGRAGAVRRSSRADRPGRHGVRPDGRIRPLYCTAHGKALLADFDLNAAEEPVRRRAAEGLVEEHERRPSRGSRRSARRFTPTASRRTTASTWTNCAAWPRRFAIRLA